MFLDGGAMYILDGIEEHVTTCLTNMPSMSVLKYIFFNEDNAIKVEANYICTI
jgi:hypothetical protein